MSDGPRFPVAGSDDVPAHVLDELIAAFGTAEPDRVHEIDFDDPSIDALLADTRPSGSAGVRPEGHPEVQVDSSATRALSSSPPRRPTIRIGGDDELPDAVYLDEDAERRLREIHAPDDDSPERSTIVIADLDESAPPIEQLPDRSRAAMDPRLRARRVAVGRAKGRRRLLIAAAVGAVLLVIVGVIAVFASSLFDVRTVHWQGTVYTDPALMRQIEDDLHGHPVLLVDARKIERQLEASPWVEDARVSSHFPHSVTVDIRERLPLVAFQGGNDGQWRIIDRDGRVLDVIPSPPEKSQYMWVLGVNPDTERGSSAGPLYAAAAQLWVALPAEIRGLTESIGVDTAAGTLTLELRLPSDPPGSTGIEVRLGDSANMPDKLARLLQIVRRGLDATVPLDVSSNDVAVAKP